MHTLAQLRSGQLAGTTHLRLAEGLTEFPPEIFTLADSLEVLNLSGNQLRDLPADLPRLRRLRVLFLSENPFTTVPAVLGQCAALEMVGFKACQLRTLPAAALPPRLRWLILTDNALESLPAEIGNCGRLQKLMLAGNRLRALPPTLARCTRLELVRLAANELPALPEWLLALPRLSWLAYAGNPFADALAAAALARHPVPDIPWAHLHLGPALGEGASGVIYQGQWDAAPGTPATPVAVKLFKGAITSDGLPGSEMAAASSAGHHPHLIGAEGRITGHPAGTPGLVLPLFAPTYRNLAGPPSFETCTRDVYAPDLRFGLGPLLRLARGVAAAGAHLHARGILHGDLYAHNLVCTPAGQVLLGDFGAASFFDPAAPTAAALQAVEVRAFGILLTELLDRCAAPADQLRDLHTLARRCQQPEATCRPTLHQVAQLLEAIQRQVGEQFGE